MTSLITTFAIAFVAALVPVLIWLFFLEQEDKHPEPKRLLFIAFVAGMVGVAISLPLEKIVADYVTDTPLMMLCWATIEEVVKFIVVYILVLRRVDNDEPIDALMYIIASALGFSALENTLFILSPLIEGNIAEALILGNFRFIGATLLHTVASSSIGIAIAFAFYRSKLAQRVYLITGVIIAVILHTLFNLSIIISNGSTTMVTFYAVWVALVFIFLLIEKVKKIKRTTI